MKKIQAMTLLLLPTLLLSSCFFFSNNSGLNIGDSSTASTERSSSTTSSSTSSSSEKTSSVDTSSVSSSTSAQEETSTDKTSYRVETFSHVFSNADFSSSSGGTITSLNGLSFTYSAFTYLGGSQQGVQIGSANNPQKTAWTLSTSFDTSIVLTSLAVELNTGSNGSGIVAFTELDISDTFSKSDSMNILEYNDFETSISSLTMSLTSTSDKALYFYSLTFTAYVPQSSSLSLQSDDDIELDPVTPGENNIPAINYQPLSASEYYKDVDLTLTGDSLKEELRTKISTNITLVSYGNARYMLQYTDEDLEESGKMYGLYDGDLIKATWDSGATWNREHVWPCSRMNLSGSGDNRPEESTKNQTSDLHNLRACCTTCNSYHSNKYYSESETGESMYPNITSGLSGYHYYSGDFRGDVSRILFYMATRYEGLYLSDDMANSDSLVTMGLLSLLLKWNKEDPVDSFEMQRNERIYAYQGNRNPFIDYPSLADSIFAS